MPHNIGNTYYQAYVSKKRKKGLWVWVDGPLQISDQTVQKIGNWAFLFVPFDLDPLGLGD